MRSRLSYYSVLLLVGLAVTSGLVLAMNPFNSPQASGSAPAQGAAPRGALTTNSTVTTSPSTSVPGGNGLGGGLQPGGALVGEHHHHDADDPVPGAGNSTTVTRSIHSQDQ